MNLSLGLDIDNSKGYAEAEKYRERFHTGGTYDASTNPIGRKGSEADYIGDFATSTDDDNFVASNATLGITGGKFRVSSSATNGYGTISISTIPSVSYTLKVDVSAIQSGSAAIVKVGTSAGDHTHHNSGNLTSTGLQTITFTATSKQTYLTLYSKTSGKWVNFDDISFKES